MSESQDRLQRTDSDIVSTAKAIMFCAWAICAIACAVAAIEIAHQTHLRGQDLAAMSGNIKNTTADIADYVHAEKDDLQSPAGKEAQLLAQTAGISEGLQKQVIPAAAASFRQLGNASTKMSATTAESAGHVNDLIDQLKDKTTGIGGLIPQATADLQTLNANLKGLTDLEAKLGLSVDDTDKVIQSISAQTGLTAEAIRKRLADPNLDDILEHLSTSTDLLNGIIYNGKLASDRLPEVAEDIKKASDASAKFAKYYWMARIVSILLGAFKLP
jgi:hypothetical protein